MPPTVASVNRARPSRATRSSAVRSGSADGAFGVRRSVVPVRENIHTHGGGLAMRLWPM